MKVLWTRASEDFIPNLPLSSPPVQLENAGPSPLSEGSLGECAEVHTKHKDFL